MSRCVWKRPGPLTEGANADPLVQLARRVDDLFSLRQNAVGLYRLGPLADPVGFAPWELCSWANRWDDPSREYRTLYCSFSPLTCLREGLADLRPNAKVLAELGPAEDVARGIVSRAWLRSHILEGAELWRRGALIDVEDVSVRARLERRHASLLLRLGLDHLDTSEVRGPSRALTQAVSRSLWEEGAAGVRYFSNLDGGVCLALFEGRAGLFPLGVGAVFSESELLRLAKHYRLGITTETVAALQPLWPLPDRRRRERRQGPSATYRGPERRHGHDRRAIGLT
jgi:hypothetical protein